MKEATPLGTQEIFVFSDDHEDACVVTASEYTDYLFAKNGLTDHLPTIGANVEALGLEAVLEDIERRLGCGFSV